jgi:ribosomal protein S18 acetylase RimI-like enzyme
MTEDYAPLIADGGVWMFELEGKVAALMVLEPDEDCMLVFSLAVLPEAQGRGLGRSMLDHAETLARQAGFRALRLYTNTKMTRNVDIYARYGFRQVGEEPNPKRPDWRVFYMEKDITPRA